MDLRAHLPGPLELKPLERQLVPTGIFIELPLGYEAQVRPRSGLAFKQGITCLNSPGTIDSDYRGELKVILINLSAEAQTLHPGDRIAQAGRHARPQQGGQHHSGVGGDLVFALHHIDAAFAGRQVGHVKGPNTASILSFRVVMVKGLTR